MKLDKCAYCSAYTPKGNYCMRHFRLIEDILSCTEAGDATTKLREIKRETGEVFSKKSETPQQEQRTYIARDLSYTDFLKNLRKSVWYRDKGGDYEMGFYHGWTTACSAALATLGVDPLDK